MTKGVIVADNVNRNIEDAPKGSHISIVTKRANGFTKDKSLKGATKDRIYIGFVRGCLDMVGVAGNVSVSKG